MSQVTQPSAGMSPADIGRLRQVGEPRVSPDGSTVAFTVADPDLEENRYARRIWLTPAGEAAPRPFTGPGRESLPRWSPDGRLLAFVATGDDGRSQVAVLPVGGGGERFEVKSSGTRCKSKNVEASRSPERISQASSFVFDL
jgi:dipeptidyl aminopeptidase/acylaminoacyl peptidase